MATLEQVKFPELNYAKRGKIARYHSNCVCWENALEFIRDRRLVIAWDGNLDDTDSIALGFLLGVEQNKETRKYNVFTDSGFDLHYDHAAVIDVQYCPSVIVKNRDENDFYEGHLTGINLDNLTALVVDIRKVTNVVPVNSIAYSSDIKIGILKEV